MGVFLQICCFKENPKNKVTHQHTTLENGYKFRDLVIFDTLDLVAENLVCYFS